MWLARETVDLRSEQTAAPQVGGDNGGDIYRRGRIRLTERHDGDGLLVLRVLGDFDVQHALPEGGERHAKQCAA